MNDRGLGRASFPRIGGKQFVLSFGHELDWRYQIYLGVDGIDEAISHFLPIDDAFEIPTCMCCMTKKTGKTYRTHSDLWLKCYNPKRTFSTTLYDLEKLKFLVFRKSWWISDFRDLVFEEKSTLSLS